MELIYKKASLNDINILAESRIEVLKAANNLDGTLLMPELMERSRIYYEKSLADGSHIAYLVFDNTTLAGTGGVSFYSVMPTCHNPTGQKAYIMNMYTRPEYRRRGIACQTLDRLVSACKSRGILHISLEATKMGRPLYEKYGFIKMENEMLLPLK